MTVILSNFRRRMALVDFVLQSSIPFTDFYDVPLIFFVVLEILRDIDQRWFLLEMLLPYGAFATHSREMIRFFLARCLVASHDDRFRLFPFFVHVIQDFEPHNISSHTFSWNLVWTLIHGRIQAIFEFRSKSWDMGYQKLKSGSHKRAKNVSFRFVGAAHLY